METTRGAWAGIGRHLKDNYKAVPGFAEEFSVSVASPQKLPSERSFGLMLTAAFAILGMAEIVRHRSWIVYGCCFIASIVFGLLTLTNPRVLVPLNKAWFYLGRGLGKIISPIVMGIVYFGILTPVSIATRLFGRDELRLKRRACNSYWVVRSSPIEAAKSFENQF